MNQECQSVCPDHYKISSKIDQMIEGFVKIEKILERFIIVEEKMNQSNEDRRSIRDEVHQLEARIRVLENKISGVYTTAMAVAGIVTIVVSALAIVYK